MQYSYQYYKYCLRLLQNRDMDRVQRELENSIAKLLNQVHE